MGRRYTHWVELITAESEASRFVRHRRIIRFPQLTMPLIAAYTPENWRVTHTDEIVQRVRFDRPFSLVGITANTAAAPHAYGLALRYRELGIPVVIGGLTQPSCRRRWGSTRMRSSWGRESWSGRDC